MILRTKTSEFILSCLCPSGPSGLLRECGDNWQQELDETRCGGLCPWRGARLGGLGTRCWKAAFNSLGFSGVGMGQRSTAGGRERGREYSRRPWASNNFLGLLLTGPIKYGLYFMIDPAFNHSLLFFVNKTSLSLPRY